MREPALTIHPPVTPNLAGWRRNRMPALNSQIWTGVAPDWVCEVLSPSTARHIRLVKMALYARKGVRHLWIVDPDLRMLEAYSLRKGLWSLTGVHGDEDEIDLYPFEAVPLPLSEFWLPEESDPST